MTNRGIMIAAILQARMDSTRLPGKTMLKIGGKPMIQHVVERVAESRLVDEVVVATSILPSDDVLVVFCKKLGVECFRGSPDDVLDRYYQAAKHFQADCIVRVTADCPLVDPQLVDKLLEIFNKGGYDFVSNTEPPWMDGFDVEVFSFDALQNAWNNAGLASEREHVTPYIRNQLRFKKYYLKNDVRLSTVHCSIDNEKDLRFVRALYNEITAAGRESNFTYADVISVLERMPALLKINPESVVNEGYFKSLKEDRKVKARS